MIPVLPPTQKRIKHFRHETGESHYEPETDEHIMGKTAILELASKLGLNAETEVRIGEHITDVFIKGKQPLAVEFQCSKCQSKEISERNQTYAEKGIATFWILGANFYEKERITKIEKEIQKKQRLIYYFDNKFRLLINHIFYDYSVIHFSAPCGIRYNGKSCTITPQTTVTLNPNDKEIFGEHKKIIAELTGNPKPRQYENFSIEWHIRSFTENKITVNNPSLTFALEQWERPFFTF